MHASVLLEGLRQRPSCKDSLIAKQHGSRLSDSWGYASHYVVRFRQSTLGKEFRVPPDRTLLVIQIAAPPQISLACSRLATAIDMLFHSRYMKVLGQKWTRLGCSTGNLLKGLV